MQSRRGSCHYPCKQTSTVGLRDATALFRAGFCCSAAQCYHFFQQQFYDPGRTRTCNLWFRRPPPYPLGHRTSWNTGSRPRQLQMPPSLELVVSGIECAHEELWGPLHVALVFHMKSDPLFLGSSKLTFLSDRFNQRTVPGLQSVSVFLVRARSFSNFCLVFFLIYFAFSCLFCFRLMVSRFPALEAIVRAKFWCIPYHFF